MTPRPFALETFSPPSAARLNRNAGWLLLLAALAIPIGMGPWSLSGDSGALGASHGTTTSLQAQTMIAVLGILQLATFHLLRTLAIEPSRRTIAAWLTASGSLLAALGYVFDPPLIVIGGFILSAGYTLMTSTSIRHGDRETTISLAMICFGMLLIAAMALYDWQLTRAPIVDLGPNDGFTLRALRLARVAAVALPVLSFLYGALSSHGDRNDRMARFGRRAMLCGVVGMATILAASGLIFSYLKTLLVIPSVAIFAGVLCGLHLARRQAAPLESWGWLVIAISLGGGLLMGLYAFAAPWVTMQFPGEYNDHARRLIRLAHVDCVVLGLIAIYIAREIEEVKSRWMPRTVKLLLLFGSISMVGLPLLFAVTGLSIATLNIGPAFIVAAIMLCIQTSPARIADVSWGGKS